MIEVRYESGPFRSKTGDYLWLLLAVHEDEQPTGQLVVRVGPKLTEKVFGPDDAFWWYACRAAADHVHRSGTQPARTIALTPDDMRRVLHETDEAPERLVPEVTVLRAW